MLRSLVPMLIISLSVGIAAWLIFMWAVKSGQFDDIEGPKHRMLDDDDGHDRQAKKGKGDDDENKDGNN